MNLTLLLLTAVIPLDLSKLAPMPGDEGASSYYRLERDERGAFIRSDYRPGMKTERLALELPESARAGHHVLHWRWRVSVLPKGGDECVEGRRDSAASVYIGWRRGLRWYGLKYAWSTAGKRGAICDSKRNPFLVGDAVLLESGAPVGEWVDERVDLEAEFRSHFGGDEVPELQGVAILSDGDATESRASADFGGFELEVLP